MSNTTTVAPLIPPDTDRCQARVTTDGPFQMGGIPGDPNDGYRRRCDRTPTVVATETKPGEDGRVGSMSLCDGCRVVAIKQLGKGFMAFKKIKVRS
jgi:hypothetical protein